MNSKPNSVFISIALLTMSVLMLAVPVQSTEFLREMIYDTTVYPDEALTNVNIANHRYPDCNTLQSTVQSIFRIEGADTDHLKAMALWKMFHVLFVVGGGNAFESGSLIHDPSKLLTVYGLQQCDGASWTLAGMWRAAGYIAYDECNSGHTIAAMRYRDDDGVMRFHTVDPMSKIVYWSELYQRIAPRTLPIMRGMVYRHMTASQNTHCLRTSLRLGETLERCWSNSGHIIMTSPVAGEEYQVVTADTSAMQYESSLFSGSVNTDQSAKSSNTAVLHPAAGGSISKFIYRVPSPYVGVSGRCKAHLVKTASDDICRLSFSKDGVTWTPFFTKSSTGEEEVDVALPSSVNCAYTFYVMAEFQTAGSPAQVGMDDLAVSVYRQLNKNTLPNLVRGRNYLRVTADSIKPGFALEVTLDYNANSTPQTVTKTFTLFPSYFLLDATIFTPTMTKLTLRLVPAVSDNEQNDSMAVHFTEKCFYPSDFPGTKEQKSVEQSNIQVSGFFPQDIHRLPVTTPPATLISSLFSSNSQTRWSGAEGLGLYPLAIDTLLYALRNADADLQVYIMKALAQIADPKALPTLLQLWKQAPNSVPGMRYVPDAIAAIGDTSAVSALISKLPLCRFDLRLHIAHALGILGGDKAVAALQDLAENDPFPAVKEYALEILSTATEGGMGPLTPSATGIASLSPNPANSSTTVHFMIASSGGHAQVDLEIYNIQGKRVRHIPVGRQKNGLHSIQWDGRNEQGLCLAAGCYFYKLRVDGLEFIKKGMRLK